MEYNIKVTNKEGVFMYHASSVEDAIKRKNYKKEYNVGCTDCVDCTGCINCRSCTGCKDCTGCYDCLFCDECIDCDNCSRCKECIDCDECSRCKECTKSIECKMCNMCIFCFNCIHESNLDCKKTFINKIKNKIMKLKKIKECIIEFLEQYFLSIFTVVIVIFIALLFYIGVKK